MLQLRPASGAQFWISATIYALAALTPITAATGVPTCIWVEELSFCTAAVEGESGSRYVAVNAATAACLANTDESGLQGCTHETPVCETVQFAESSATVCLPPGAAFASSVEYFGSFSRFESCIGRNGSDCPKVRQEMYTALGCKECADIHETCRVVAPECYQATNESLCTAAATAVSAGGTASAGGNGTAGFGMLGGFRFDDDETLEEDLRQVSQVPGVLSPEEAAAAAASRATPVATLHSTAALFAAAATALVFALP